MPEVPVDPNPVVIPEAAPLPPTLPDPPPAAAVEIAPLEAPDPNAAPASPMGSVCRAGIDPNPIRGPEEGELSPPETAGQVAPSVSRSEAAPEAPVRTQPEERFPEDGPRDQGGPPGIRLPPRGMFPAAGDPRARGPLVDPRLRAEGIPAKSNYDPRDWYWLAADGRLYGSKRQDFVEEPDTDEAYQAWRNAGNTPSAWPKDESGVQSDQALQDLLAAYDLDMDPPSLDEIKVESINSINWEAEGERMRYATPGDLMIMTYVEKVAQARAAVEDPDATPDKYPMLAATIGIDGDDVLGVAETVLEANTLWMNINAAIEAERKRCNAEIDAAPDADAVRAVTPDWPTP